MTNYNPLMPPPEVPAEPEPKPSGWVYIILIAALAIIFGVVYSFLTHPGNTDTQYDPAKTNPQEACEGGCYADEYDNEDMMMVTQAYYVLDEHDREKVCETFWDYEDEDLFTYLNKGVENSSVTWAMIDFLWETC